MNGTRVPPSKLLYLPPRYGPAGLWLPSFAIIFVAIVNDWPVVAREDHQRVASQVQTIQRGQHLPYRPVGLHDRVAARTHRRPAREARMRNTRHVRIVRREVQ